MHGEYEGRPAPLLYTLICALETCNMRDYERAIFIFCLTQYALHLHLHSYNHAGA